MKTLLLALVATLIMATSVTAQPASLTGPGGWRSIVDLSVISFSEGAEDGEGVVNLFRGAGAGVVYGWPSELEFGGALMFSSVEVISEGAETEREAQMVFYAPVRVMEVLDLGPTIELWSDTFGWMDQFRVGLGVNLRLFGK